MCSFQFFVLDILFSRRGLYHVETQSYTAYEDGLQSSAMKILVACVSFTWYLTHGCREVKCYFKLCLSVCLCLCLCLSVCLYPQGTCHARRMLCPELHSQFLGVFIRQKVRYKISYYELNVERPVQEVIRQDCKAQITLLTTYE